MGLLFGLGVWAALAVACEVAPGAQIGGLHADGGGLPPGSDTGGPSKCATSGFKLCESFESGSIDSALWSQQVASGSNNSLGVDTIHAARGTRALHVSASGIAGTDVLIRTTKAFPFTGNAFFGRAYVYVKGPLPTYNYNFISASGSGGGVYDFAGQGSPFGSASSTRIFRFHYSPGDVANKSTTVIPTDQWACWEWSFKGPTNELNAWLNGKEIDMAVLGSAGGIQWTAPTFGQLAIGIHHAHPEPLAKYEVWYDEIALNGTRIGCQP